SAYVITGCATNPVTGQNQLMLMGRSEEIDIDRKNAPHQLSADYGPSSDPVMSAYISQLGNELSRLSHRPNMPYSYNVVDATYVNAYAFPGGTIAATRGIMASLDNEAALAALLGHEIGHVNARHTSSRMSKAMLTQVAVVGLVVVAASSDDRLAPLAAGLGALGAGALLAKYSRDDERQADELGMEYMVRAGYNPQGMVGLMDLLRGMRKNKPGALEMMFSSHPMSDERYATAVSRASTQYMDAKNLKLGRERHMDSTASLRKIKPALDKMQKGEAAMKKKQYRTAESQFSSALKLAPNDYAGLMMMAKCQLARQKPKKARNFAQRAKQVKPSEPQSGHVLGMASLYSKDYRGAYNAFSRYEGMLPGNPNTVFMKGLSAEGMGDKRLAAREYMRYARADNRSKQGQYAVSRLSKWGYLKQRQ
ncbi:MAG: M48 family metalloprotease, partial [Nitrospinota bacterium]|nr:M48 family metalloprotease [Nitrospinota bacterium]